MFHLLVQNYLLISKFQNFTMLTFSRSVINNSLMILRQHPQYHSYFFRVDCDSLRAFFADIFFDAVGDVST